MFHFDTDPARGDYDAFVGSHPTCTVLQSWAWADIKREWSARRFLVKNESGEILLAAQVLIRRLPLGFTFWYLPKGPVCDYNDQPLLEFFLRELATVARAGKCALLKIDPPVEIGRWASADDYSFELPKQAGVVMTLFSKAGYTHQGFSKDMGSTIQPRFTTKVVNDGDFTANLANRTKRFIKDAAKREVKVRRASLADLDSFMYVVNKTVARKHVALRSREYFARFFEAYGDNCLLYLAEIDLRAAAADYAAQLETVRQELATVGEKAPKKKRSLEEKLASLSTYADFYAERARIDGDVATLAGCLSVLYGRGLEMLYAGMNDDYAKIPAQFPVYVDSMREAFDKGAVYASMGGVEGSLDDSLLTFKMSFGPQIVEEIGEFDLPLIRPVAWGFTRGLPLAKKIVRTIKRG